jgi:CP family cyanate transporter-like MFS transporter
MAAETTVARRTREASLVALITAVAALAVNLRPAITTIGPELGPITTHFQAGSTTGGVITALPVMTFALVSLAAPILLDRISARAGLHLALALVGVGVAGRPWGGLALFIVGTALAAMGIGLLAVLLPVIIRSTGHTGVLVTTFTTALQAGSAIGFAAVVPLSRVFGGWQWGLAVWAALAPLAMGALWMSRLAPAGPATPAAGPRRARYNPIVVLRSTGTTRLAVFFGLQALVAFVVIGWLPSVLDTAGVSSQAAGLYLGLMTCLGVPISLAIPPLVARSAYPGRWLGGFSAFTVLGVLTFIIAPRTAPLLWTLVLGVGLSVFSLALTVITVNASMVHQAAGVSSAVQGVGYGIAAIGPYVIGVVRHFSDDWTLPLGLLLATAVLQLVLGFTVRDARGRTRQGGLR